MTLVSLQVLRGIAALAIVLFHLLPFEAKYLPGAALVPDGFAAGRAGVDVFFVLSGFLAVWTTRAGNRGGAAARTFLMRRVTRIYPTYWVYGVPLAAAALLPSMQASGPHPDIAASLLLLPSATPPLLLVAWTLTFEIYFYLAFALLVWAGLHRGGLLLALTIWGALVAGGHAALAPARSQVTLDILLSPLVFEFLLGCAAARVCHTGHGRGRAVGPGMLGALTLAVALGWSETLFAAPWLRVLAYGTGTGLLLIGCARADAGLRRVLPAVLVRLGDGSYSLYLSHLFVLAIAGRTLAYVARFVPWLATPAGHAMALLGVVAAAVLAARTAHLQIERPLIRLTRQLQRSSDLKHAARMA